MITGTKKPGVSLAVLMSLVPVKGLEPSWGHPRLILSQLRIPFRHTGSVAA